MLFYVLFGWRLDIHSVRDNLERSQKDEESPNFTSWHSGPFNWGDPRFPIYKPDKVSLISTYTIWIQLPSNVNWATVRVQTTISIANDNRSTNSSFRLDGSAQGDFSHTKKGGEYVDPCLMKSWRNNIVPAYFSVWSKEISQIDLKNDSYRVNQPIGSYWLITSPNTVCFVRIMLGNLWMTSLVRSHSSLSFWVWKVVFKVCMKPLPICFVIWHWT